MRMTVMLSSVLVGAMLATSVQATVKLPTVFGDHMVLQREIEIPVWGVAEPGEKVTVKLAGQETQATADTNGLWRVKLAPMKATSQPLIMTVAAGTNTITIQDVLIGDVWLCSGQSNMFALRNCDSADDIQSAEFPLIRHYAVPQRQLVEPLDDPNWKDAAHPAPDPKVKWDVCHKESAGSFVGVGFYFARKVHQATGVPIGLLHGSWGGVNIETFLPPEGVASVPELKPMREEFARKLAVYRQEVADQLPDAEARLRETRQALAQNQPLPLPLQWPRHPSSAATYQTGPRELYSLYNGMIHPLIPYAIKGVLWYQGASNIRDTDIDLYIYKMRALIEGWRAAWGQGNFPFYYVLMATVGPAATDPASNDEGWPKIQQAQAKALSLAIPRTGMAVAIDIGEANGDIHPKNKKDVGERLALWALKNDYGQSSLECSGPLFREMKVEGNKARIFFDHVGSGLMVGKKEGKKPTQEDKGGKLQRFAIAGADGKWVWAEAVIDGQTVVVSSTNVPAPTAVRYAYANNPLGCNLYNREGLPAAPIEARIAKQK